MISVIKVFTRNPNRDARIFYFLTNKKPPFGGFLFYTPTLIRVFTLERIDSFLFSTLIAI